MCSWCAVNIVSCDVSMYITKSDDCQHEVEGWRRNWRLQWVMRSDDIRAGALISP